MHDRHDLTDEQWEILEPFLPDRTPVRGGQWKDPVEPEAVALLSVVELRWPGP